MGATSSTNWDEKQVPWDKLADSLRFDFVLPKITKIPNDIPEIGSGLAHSSDLETLWCRHLSSRVVVRYLVLPKLPSATPHIPAKIVHAYPQKNMITPWSTLKHFMWQALLRLTANPAERRSVVYVILLKQMALLNHILPYVHRQVGMEAMS